MNNVLYKTVNYFNKNWDEETGTYTNPVISSEETAVAIANLYLDNLKNEGYCKNYSLQSVFYDTVDAIWIVSFGEKTDEVTLGADCSIALRKSDGKVMRIWFGE